MQIGLRSLVLTTAAEHPSERNYTPWHGDALHKSVSSKAAIICMTDPYAVVVQFCDKPQVLADLLGEVKCGLYLSQNVGNRL